MNDHSDSLMRRCLPPGLLRLILAATVVIHHISKLSLGQWAVNVFFVLSGYWVTTMYRKRYVHFGRPALSFYASRYMRLVPVLAVCQVLMILMLLYLHSSEVSVLGPVWFLRSALVLGSAHQRILLVPSWSLDVEAQFYFVVPLLLYLLGRLRPEVGARLTLVAAAILLPLSLLRETEIHNPWLWSFFTFFLIGVAQALAPWKPKAVTATLSASAFFLVIMLGIAMPATRHIFLSGSHPTALYRYNGPLCGLLTLVILPCVAFSLTIRSSLRDRHLGNLAYPLYLFHWVLMAPLQAGLISPSPLKAKIYYLLMVVAGSLILEYAVDQPFERWRESLMRLLFKEGAGKESLAHRG